MGGALCLSGILLRLSPASARTKNTMANIIPTQKIGSAAAFDLFMVLLLRLRASVPEFVLMLTPEPQLTLYDSAAGR
jgi:hypothetical protein